MNEWFKLASNTPARNRTAPQKSTPNWCAFFFQKMLNNFVFSIFFRIFVYKQKRKEKMKLLILSIALFFATPKTATTNSTSASYPCHPNGDLYPCTHPAHSMGDLGPCTHYYPNGKYDACEWYLSMYASSPFYGWFGTMPTCLLVIF